MLHLIKARSQAVYRMFRTVDGYRSQTNDGVNLNNKVSLKLCIYIINI